MTDRKLVILACLLYQFKLCTTASCASSKLCTAFGECALSERNARNWLQMFCCGKRAGLPITPNNDDLMEALELGYGITCHEQAFGFNLSNGTIKLHLHLLGENGH